MKTKKTEKLTPWRIILSVLAAAFGVQSNRNREQDFTQGNIYIYIIAGILFTVFFVIAIVVIVNLILPTTI